MTRRARQVDQEVTAALDAAAATAVQVVDPPAAQADVDVDDDTPKSRERVDLRNVKIGSFDGSVAKGAFDSKAKDWWEEFSNQVADAQEMAHQTWSKGAKKSVLNQHLTGMARRWFRDWRREHAASTFDDAGAALVREFKPALPSQEIRQRVYGEKKKPDETYREYTDRLLQMTDALDGGNHALHNAREALHTFVRLAYPRYSDFLVASIDLETSTPRAALALAIQLLTKHAKSDGRSSERRPAATPDAATKPKDKAHAVGKAPAAKPARDKKPAKADGGRKRPAEGNAATVERKKKPAHNNKYTANITCYVCGMKGHTAKFHRKHLSDGADDEEGASANQAIGSDDDDQDEDEE